MSTLILFRLQGLSCAVWLQYTTPQTTDTAIAIDQCNSIDDLKQIVLWQLLQHLTRMCSKTFMIMTQARAELKIEQVTIAPTHNILQHCGRTFSRLTTADSLRSSINDDTWRVRCRYPRAVNYRSFNWSWGLLWTILFKSIADIRYQYRLSKYRRCR